MRLLLMLEQRYSCHVKCQLTDVCIQMYSRSNPSVSKRFLHDEGMRRSEKYAGTCVYVLAAGVIPTTVFWQFLSNTVHISQTALRRMPHMLMLPGGCGQKHATVWRQTGVDWRHKVIPKRSFGRSLVMTNQSSPSSCCAHPIGCCKTLALILIKTLTTGRADQMVA